MAASEFVELDITKDTDTTDPTTTTTTTTTTTDHQSFLQHGQHHLNQQHQQQSSTRGKYALGVAVFLCVCALVIIIVATTTASALPPTITQQCLSPTDPSIDTATLYHLQGHYIALSYSLFLGLNAKLEGTTDATGIDVLLKTQDQTARCDWVWLNTDQTRIFNLAATASVFDGTGTSGNAIKDDAVLQIVHHPTIDVVGVQLSPTTVHKLFKRGASNNLVLHFNYNLQLGSQLDGFYVSKWQDKSAHTHTIIASQMEATSARKAFPCIDQPSDKATFSIHVGCSDCEQYTVLGNMPTFSGTATNSPAWSLIPQRRTTYAQNHPNTRLVSFEETPRMSTYLVALTIGELEYTETVMQPSASNANAIQIRIYTTKGSKALGTYALSAAKTVLELYQFQFNIDYPLPKCDMVAIPDFAAGAMENWGLVLYRETALLVDPALSSDADKQRVAVVVAHELAHQWFGNLVTMVWWNDLWLNEGFATYTEYQGTDAIDAGFGVWDQFLNDVTQPALALDGTLTGTHALHQELSTVTTPGAIEELFDTIDYSKGGAVVRMVALALDREYGVNTWSFAIENYLKQHQYNNAKSMDLWTSAAEQIQAPNDDITSKLLTWSNQEGYPLVRVTSSGLEQERFYNSHTTTPAGTKWWIPVTYVRTAANGGVYTPSDVLACAMLPDTKNPSATTCPPMLPPPGSGGAYAQNCLKLNIGTIGFYRVQYTLLQWQCLLTTFHTLPTEDRSGVIDDVFTIARSATMDQGLLSTTYDIPLQFAAQLKQEQDLSVWTPGVDHLLYLLRVLATPATADCATKMNAFYLDVIGPRVTALGIVPAATDTHLTRLLRVTLVGSAAVHGHHATIAQAQAIFADPVQSKALLPDEQSIVYKTVVRWGTKTDFNAILALYNAATFAPEKKRYMYALAATRDPGLIQQVLNMALGDTVRSQDTVSLLAAVGSYSEGRGLAWTFVKKNWDVLYARYGSGGFALTRLVLIASRFTTKEMLADVKTFFQTHPVPAAERAVARAMEEVEASAARSTANNAQVCAWLENNA